VLRVYLDQNKWVDLARAATVNPDGEKFVEALELCRAAAGTGAASFPLDMYRYAETSKRRDDRSRNDVVDVMLELSQQHTMAVPAAVLPHEIDLALQRRFGRPEMPREQRVFGIGLDHVTGGRMTWPELDLSSVPGLEDAVSPGLRVKLERDLRAYVEEQLHRAGPERLRKAGFDRAQHDLGQRFVDHEDGVAAGIARLKLSGDMIDAAVRTSDLGDIRPAVTTGLELIGMTWDEFWENSTVGEVMSFMDDLPTRYVTNVMRSAKHRQSEQKWEPNDFFDILGLPVAAVYCDVVVTEKQWAHRMRQGKIDQRYGTQILASTADLVGVLVAASLS